MIKCQNKWGPQLLNHACKSVLHTQNCVPCTNGWCCGGAPLGTAANSAHVNPNLCLETDQLVSCCTSWGRGGAPTPARAQGSGTVEIWHQTSPKCRGKDKPTASETLFSRSTLEGYQPVLNSSIVLLYLTSITLQIKGRKKEWTYNQP